VPRPPRSPRRQHGNTPGSDNLDDVDGDGSAEIIRKTTIGGSTHQDTSNRKIPTTGIGSFIVGNSTDEWIDSDAAVQLEGWR